MTPITIDVNAWHYRMIRKFNSGALWRCRDLCVYTRAVVMTAVMLGIVTALCTFTVGAIIGDTIAWIAACISLSTWIDPGVGVVVIVGLFILVLLFIAADRFNEWRLNRRFEPVAPSALKLAYLSWKDKYCTKIIFSDE